MDLLRTPAHRFDKLPDFPWEAMYLEDIAPARVALIDEGPQDAEHTFLCLHGEPTWSFLYRKMIPVFLESGARVVAPDLLGFGRSDKPTDDAFYSFAMHRDTLLQLIERLDLSNITLVCQDWGGLLGLTLPLHFPERFSRLLVMNTGLAVGTPPSRGFLQWQQYVRENPDFDVGRVMRRSEAALTDQEVAAYEAPFPTPEHKAGVRTFPLLVPTSPEHPGAALSREAAVWWNQSWSGSTFMAVGMHDPVLGPPVMKVLQQIIRGCPEPMMVDAGHFVQERGEAVARAALAAWA